MDIVQSEIVASQLASAGDKSFVVNNLGKYKLVGVQIDADSLDAVDSVIDLKNNLLSSGATKFDAVPGTSSQVLDTAGAIKIFWIIDFGGGSLEINWTANAVTSGTYTITLLAKSPE